MIDSTVKRGVIVDARFRAESSKNWHEAWISIHCKLKQELGSLATWLNGKSLESFPETEKESFAVRLQLQTEEAERNGAKKPSATFLAGYEFELSSEIKN